MWVERNGPTWRVRERIGGRKVTLAEGYPSETIAERARVLLLADAMRGESLVPRGGRVTLDEWLDEWWPSYERTLKETSIDSEGARVRNHIRPLLGAYSLDELDSGAVQQWVADLAAGAGPWPSRGRRRPLAPKSISNAHGLLFTILRGAVDRRLIRVNPAAATNLPARRHVEMRYLTDPEIERLVAAMPAHWRPLVVLLVATGLRWGEAIGLRAGRVDLLAARPRLRVLEQLQERAGRGSAVYFSTPKTERSRRTVTFTRSVALELAPLVANREPDAAVFLTATGALIRTRNFRRVWLTACRRAGLEGLRIHDLRHTHAAMLLSAGVEITKVSRRLGHASVAVTDRIYGQLRQDHDDDVLAVVTASLAGLDAQVDLELVDELG